MREKIFAATITALAASATLAGKTLHTYGDSPPLQSIAEPETMEVTLFDEHPEWGYKVETLERAMMRWPLSSRTRTPP